VNDKVISLNSSREKFSSIKSTGVKFALDQESPKSKSGKQVKFRSNTELDLLEKKPEVQKKPSDHSLLKDEPWYNYKHKSEKEQNIF
jgi:hypothetical protein